MLISYQHQAAHRPGAGLRFTAGLSSNTSTETTVSFALRAEVTFDRVDPNKVKQESHGLGRLREYDVII